MRGPLAAGVCWARVATARHFATDVVAGVVLGTVAGVAASTTVYELEDRLTSGRRPPT